MKLATLNDGSRDGQLLVVSRDLAQAHHAQGIVGRLRALLDDWNFLAPPLEDLYRTLNQGKARHAFPFDPRQCLAPLPRAGRWVLAHAAAEGATPACADAAPNDLDSPHAPLAAPAGDVPLHAGLRLALVTDDVPPAASAARALEGVRLLALACTWCTPGAPPWAAMAPVAVTPDELGEQWVAHAGVQPLCRLNDRAVALSGAVLAGAGDWLARAAAARGLRVGSVVALPEFEPAQPLVLQAEGDTFWAQVLGRDGHSLFGALAQARLGAMADLP